MSLDNKHRTNTLGAKEWLTTLTSKWDIDSTTMRESSEGIVVTHCKGRNSYLLVGKYSKVSKKGYVLDRRLEDRK